MGASLFGVSLSSRFIETNMAALQSRDVEDSSTPGPGDPTPLDQETNGNVGAMLGEPNQKDTDLALADLGSG